MLSSLINLKWQDETNMLTVLYLLLPKHDQFVPLFVVSAGQETFLNPAVRLLQDGNEQT